MRAEEELYSLEEQYGCSMCALNYLVGLRVNEEANVARPQWSGWQWVQSSLESGLAKSMLGLGALLQLLRKPLIAML